MSLPLVSIVIPTKNNENTIEKCLNSILLLNYQNFEVIVVNDGSQDKTQQILEKFKEKFEHKNISYTILKTDGVGPSAARNLAIKIARGEYIAFTDADCIVDREWLNELIKGFEFSSEVMGVGGDQKSPEDDTDFGKLVNLFMHIIGFVTEYVKSENKQKFSETSHNPTCNVMYKKEVFDKVGYFLEGLWPGEDVELDYRIKKMGYKLLYNPNAMVYHYRPNTFKKFIDMMTRYGEVQAKLVKRYGFFRTIHFIPIIFHLFIIFLLYLLFVRSFLFFNLLFFLLLCFFFYFLVKSKNFLKSVKLSTLFILTILFWNKGFIIGVLKKQ
ncbi:MAG: glycosyltransferase [Candidatus Aenigmatarchaeota archaeon]